MGGGGKWDEPRSLKDFVRTLAGEVVEVVLQRGEFVKGTVEEVEDATMK
jgi:hypothetical protein